MRQTGRKNPTRQLLRVLRQFHAMVDDNDLARLATIVPAQMQGSDFNLQFEAAWALLQAFAMAPLDDENAGESDSELQALLALMPPYQAWMRYLEVFPDGNEAETFRKERLAFVARWYVHVHPNRSMLEQYAMNSSDAAITAHVDGPHHCLHCRQTITSLRGGTNESRLAAFTPDEPSIAIRIVEDATSYVAGIVDDGGYLRVFLLPDDQETDSSVHFEVVVLFESGSPLHGRIGYPEHSMVGINCGKLGSRSLNEIVGVDIEKPVNKRA